MWQVTKKDNGERSQVFSIGDDESEEEFFGTTEV
jgi:hypothetical protein